MAKNFNSSALPEHCYAVLPGSGQLIEVRRGEKGYYPCAYSTGDREYNKVLANYFNAHEGISKAQAAAMLAGSMFGWNVPAADPACYDAEGRISQQRVKALAHYLLDKGVKGLYVGGSSGECIYQSVEERKAVLEAVMEEVGGKLTVIAHVACNNTQDSCELAAHAESLHVDAIASIPPIYFHLPADAVAKYWNDISAAAPHTPFVIYNIPQLAGTALNLPLLRMMKKKELKFKQMEIFQIY